MVRIEVIPALNDNYIYLATSNNKAALIDPGESAPALDALTKSGCELQAILLTHRHADHIDGVAEICQRHPHAHIYAPQECGIKNAIMCAEGDSFNILDDTLNLSVYATPGHTLGHIVFYGGNILFSGDTLFACGCGRVFEGSMEQMQEALTRLTTLADDTLVYCGHEYTTANIAFAQAVEPQNVALQKRAKDVAALRRENLPTVPFSIADEKQCNPFLRLTESTVIAAAKERASDNISTAPASIFTVLRQWKDSF